MYLKIWTSSRRDSISSITAAAAGGVVVVIVAVVVIVVVVVQGREFLVNFQNSLLILNTEQPGDPP